MPADKGLLMLLSSNKLFCVRVQLFVFYRFPFYVLPDPFVFCQTPLMFCRTLLCSAGPFCVLPDPLMFCRICNPAVNTAPIPVTHIVLVFCRICNPAVLSMRIYNPSILAACGVCICVCSRITNPDTLCRRITNPPEHGAPILVTHIVLVFCRICNPAVLSMRIYIPSILAACGICSSACFRITNPDTLCRRIANPPEHETLTACGICSFACSRITNPDTLCRRIANPPEHDKSA